MGVKWNESGHSVPSSIHYLSGGEAPRFAFAYSNKNILEEISYDELISMSEI